LTLFDLLFDPFLVSASFLVRFFDLRFDPYAIYGKICALLTSFLTHTPIFGRTSFLVRFLTLFDLLFDMQKCKTVLLTFNNNKPFIINMNIKQR